MTELLFWIGACGLALSIGAPLVYLALFDPPLEKKLLLVAASACSALLLALYVNYPLLHFLQHLQDLGVDEAYLNKVRRTYANKLAKVQNSD